MKKILLLCDDYWHPGEIVKEALSFLNQKSEYQLDVMMDGTKITKSLIEDYSLIILSKSNEVDKTNKQHWLNPELSRKFVDFVEEGNGLLVTHSGLFGYETYPEIHNLIGSKFQWHPEKQQPVTVKPTLINDITDGINDFTEVDEHYFIDIHKDDVEIFCKSYSVDGEQPAGYTRTQGKGKVCVLTPGHNLPVWENDDYKKLIENSLSWLEG